jgi:hypothetical protein
VGVWRLAQGQAAFDGWLQALRSGPSIAVPPRAAGRDGLSRSELVRDHAQDDADALRARRARGGGHDHPHGLAAAAAAALALLALAWMFKP